MEGDVRRIDMAGTRSACWSLAAALLFLVPAPAAADVVAVSAAGFTSRTIITIPAAPEAAYATVVNVKEWWNKDHTYSGDSRNLSIAAAPGGCFCEALPGGGVQHGTVALAWPGRTLRVIGALGPLQEMGVSGAMTWQFEKAAQGTRITFTYVVGGNPTMPFEKLAPLVDGVMAAQMASLKAYADRK
jgi:hypothetical protein